jgi:hypothetical protein
MPKEMGKDGSETKALRILVSRIPFTIASKKKKNPIPRSKLNKGCERPLQGEFTNP